jgi:hypothetical protein
MIAALRPLVVDPAGELGAAGQISMACVTG